MGTWGSGPLENDEALDYVADQSGALIATVEQFLDAPEFHNFAPAYAALELLNLYAKHTPTSLPVPAEIDRWQSVFLGAIDREIATNPKDAGFEKKRRKVLEKLLRLLAAHSVEFHRGAAGTPSSALSRLLSRAARNVKEDEFTIKYGDLIGWVEPYGEDVQRMWTESTQGDWMFAIARVLRVPTATLHAFVVEAVEPQLARLPADVQRGNAPALEAWSTAALDRRQRELLPLAAIARAGAHVARAVATPDGMELALALKNLLDAAKLEASVAAAKAGMDWLDAMATADGPGWTAWHKLNAELASLFRAHLPASELTVPR